MPFTEFNIIPSPPCTNISELPNDLIIEIFTYLVFDDLQDCTGVDKMFHSNVMEALKFLILIKKITPAYYVESRVSYKLARVRLGINTGIKIINNNINNKKKSNGNNNNNNNVLTHYPKDNNNNNNNNNNREIIFSVRNSKNNNEKVNVKTTRINHKHAKKWKISTSKKRNNHPNINKKTLTSLPNVMPDMMKTNNFYTTTTTTMKKICLMKKKKNKKHLLSKSKKRYMMMMKSTNNNKLTNFNDIRTFNVQKEIQNIEKEKENYLRTPSSINNTTISSSRVHVIGKPKKALIVNKTIINSQDSSQNNCNNNNHYRNPSPPPGTNTNLYNLNGRRNVHKIVKRNKNKRKKNNHNTSSSMKHFVEMIGRDRYKEWSKYKKTKGGKVKDMNQYKTEQKLKMYNNNKNIMTGLVSRQRNNYQQQQQQQQQQQLDSTDVIANIYHQKLIPFR